MISSSRVCFLSAVAALLLLAGCMNAGPAGAVKQFFHLVEEGEVDAAAEMFSGDMVAMMGREKLKAGLSQQTREISEKGGIDDIDILSEDVTGQVADVQVRVTYGNGETDEQDIQLTKIDGDWKLTPKMDK